MADKLQNLEYNDNVLMSYSLSNKLIKELENIDTTNDISMVPKQLPLDCFEIIDSPNNLYTNSTNKIDISSIPVGLFINSITDGNQTISFSSSMEKLEAPNDGWNNWGFPPATESNTTDVLFSNWQNIINLTLDKPSSVFGFEMEANLFGTFPLTVEFYSGTTLIGQITKNVTTPDGASLFAAKTCCDHLFDNIKILVPSDVLGFSIAQIRYNTDINCCCCHSTPVEFENCADYLEPELIEADLKSQGRLLVVKIKIKACKKRKVAVGALIYKVDPITLNEDLVKFKVCEGYMPNPDTADYCVEQVFKFCFVFETELCEPLKLNIKTIAEYSSFDFYC